MLPKKGVKDEIPSNALLMQQYGTSKIGLFCSFARQEQKKDSDVDILIDFQNEKETFANFMAIFDLLDGFAAWQQVIYLAVIAKMTEK